MNGLEKLMGDDHPNTNPRVDSSAASRARKAKLDALKAKLAME